MRGARRWKDGPSIWRCVDPRGWRLGGGVTYSALTTARLGLATGALVGVDPRAATAPELDLLRQTGVDVRLVPLAHGPVFENVERPEGRHQRAFSPSDRIPVDAVPDAWRSAAGWILAPVAAELDDRWAAVPSAAAYVAVGWQGLLRELDEGRAVVRRAPAPSALLARADLVGISRDDVSTDTELTVLTSLLRPGTTLAFTNGDRGGLLVTSRAGGGPRVRHYPAVRSHAPVDPTGAGDVFLAALATARLELRLAGEPPSHGADVLLAAAAASIVIEAPGLLGVGDRAAVHRRMHNAFTRVDGDPG
jgi:sugar/nucleoside kinase (ribokinase family)